MHDITAQVYFIKVNKTCLLRQSRVWPVLVYVQALPLSPSYLLGIFLVHGDDCYFSKYWGLSKLYCEKQSYTAIMEIGDGCGLSPRKVEYLKYLHGKGGRVRTTDIAREFSVDPSTITKTITELCAAGLVAHEPYHGIGLSDEGRRYTEYIVKRHRILSLMLTHYGFSHEQACAEASRFESFVTKEAIDRICIAMGHPRLGVCGAITHDDGCLESGMAP